MERVSHHMQSIKQASNRFERDEKATGARQDQTTTAKKRKRKERRERQRDPFLSFFLS